METATTQRQGQEAEEFACRHLEDQGLKLLARNYRSPFGEIDLIMLHADTVVFVEVRFRRNIRFGAPAETVDNRKRARLRTSAEHYLQRSKKASKKPCRFDIVAITQGPGGQRLQWFQNAFQ